MSPLYIYNNKLLVRAEYGNKLSISENCCCGDCDCYQVDYSWTFFCHQQLTDITLSGTILIGETGIACYNDTNAVSVSASTINYGPICFITPDTPTLIVITCNPQANITTIVLSVDSSVGDLETIQETGNLCCGDLIGTYNYVRGIDLAFYDFSMTISLANLGACNCTGYTPI